MNAPDSSRADDRYKWIAGYVDGELDEAARRRAEAWLANDPAAADALRDQEQFSPANRELWDAVAPPEPSPAAWAGGNGPGRRRGPPGRPAGPSDDPLGGPRSAAWRRPRSWAG